MLVLSFIALPGLPSLRYIPVVILQLIQGSHSDSKTCKNGKAFSSQGRSQGILKRLEKSGKSRGKSHKILESSGNFRQMLFLIFSDIYMNCGLFAKINQVFSLEQECIPVGCVPAAR